MHFAGELGTEQAHDLSDDSEEQEIQVMRFVLRVFLQLVWRVGPGTWQQFLAEPYRVTGLQAHKRGGDFLETF